MATSVAFVVFSSVPFTPLQIVIPNEAGGTWHQLRVAMYALNEFVAIVGVRMETSSVFAS